MIALRTVEWMPSAPTTTSASAVAPLWNCTSTRSVCCLSPTHRWSRCSTPRGTAADKRSSRSARLEVIVRRAEVKFACVGQRLSSKLAPVVPSADDNCVRPHSHAAHRLRKPEPIQDSRRVRAYLDAGADLAQFSGLLEDLNVEAGASKRQRRREPTDPRSDDDNSHVRARRLRTVLRIRLPGIYP